MDVLAGTKNGQAINIYSAFDKLGLDITARCTLGLVTNVQKKGNNLYSLVKTASRTENTFHDGWLRCFSSKLRGKMKRAATSYCRTNVFVTDFPILRYLTFEYKFKLMY